MRAPDVGFVTDARIPPGDGFWPFAPDLAVEVVSPDDSWTQVEAKARQWLAAGTREVWIVDPTLREVRRLELDVSVGAFRDGGTVQSRVLPGLQLDVTRIFGR